MERTFKHIITNKTIIIGGQTGESMQKLISSKASDLTIQDIIVNSSEWEEIIDKNPLKLEVGKEYILQYIHCKSKPQHVKITHFTEQGYPWQERVRDGGCRGIVSPGCYKLIEEIIEYPIGTKAEDNRINKTFVKKEDGWYNSNKTAHTDKSISDARWIDIVEDEKVDKNPLKLEVGKSYKLQYKHCVSPIRTAKITRITPDGFPWMECDDYKGIVSPDCYNLIEEIIEKDYEILSFITNMEVEFDINDDKTYSHRKHIRYSLKEMLEDDGLKIYSVKRLSDGEVFTIGDNTNAGVIEQFSICGNTLQLKVDGLIFLDDYLVKKSKQPLFTTEDGVDIFEGDKYYYSLSKSFFIQRLYVRDFEHYFLTKYPYNKRFSTKEAAEEYILMNKPCLSMQDLKITGCLNEKQWFAILDLVKYKSKL